MTQEKTERDEWAHTRLLTLIGGENRVAREARDDIRDTHI